MNNNVDADGNVDPDEKKKENEDELKYMKEHNLANNPHPFQGISNPLTTNLMMQNPMLRMLMPMMLNKNGQGTGINRMLDNPYMKMYNNYAMMSNPHFMNAIPYASLGYEPNLFGHGMPIYHGTLYENKPITAKKKKFKLRRRIMDDKNKKKDEKNTVSNGGYHGGLYQNGGKHPLHSPWRVKMRRCRLKNGQRVIYPASQVNMDKFEQICQYDPNAPDAEYSIDINVPVKCSCSMALCEDTTSNCHTPQKIYKFLIF